MLSALPVVSGNTGAFRRDVLNTTGLLRTDTVGEDLELTWRVYRAGYRVAYLPTALVYAESPSTVRGLWRQRVRWARGLLQSVRLHGDMVGNPRYRFFGIYLALNYISQVVVPLIQRGRAASCAKLHHISSGTTLIEARRPPDVVQFREGHPSREGEQLSPAGPPFVGQRGVQQRVVPDRLARVVRGEAGSAHQMTLTAKAQPNEYPPGRFVVRIAPGHHAFCSLVEARCDQRTGGFGGVAVPPMEGIENVAQLIGTPGGRLLPRLDRA